MLSAYARENIFLPLGMKESMFQPRLRWCAHRTHRASHEDATPCAAFVHDPTARNMGGVAARGLFLHRRRPGASPK